MPSKNQTRPYRGRFAPSPTGDLHFGSLIAAVASYLDARANRGAWLVRVEDIDPPREVPGSARSILDDLARLGMQMDGEVRYQSARMDHYDAVIQSLIDAGEAYWCGCSRADIPDSGIYPGTCREGLRKGRKPRSVRLRTSHEPIGINDQIQGRYETRLEETAGDFVIRRADGLAAYQLAVVVDDAEQGMTHIVRGADLLDSTPRQVLLQHKLSHPTPVYAHLPVATRDNAKLSKRLGSDPIASCEPGAALAEALRFLGHPPPGEMSLPSLWDWAVEHWSLGRVPRTREIALDSEARPEHRRL